MKELAITAATRSYSHSNIEQFVIFVALQAAVCANQEIVTIRRTRLAHEEVLVQRRVLEDVRCALFLVNSIHSAFALEPALHPVILYFVSLVAVLCAGLADVNLACFAVEDGVQVRREESAAIETMAAI